MPADPAAEARYLLPAAQSEQIFRDHIAPLLAGAEPQERPVVVVLSAQPGAGKTTLTAALRDGFASRGGVVSVEIDMLKPFHPRYRDLIAEGIAHDEPIMADARRWLERSLDYLAAARVNVIAEHGLRTRELTDALIGRFSDAGYRIEGALVGTPSAASRLGILARYQVAYERTGYGRYYPEDRHDERFAHLEEIADWFDEDPRVSRVTVYRRGRAEPVHSNERGRSGAWRRPVATRGALVAERTRPWTLEESRAFLRLHSSLAARMAPEWERPLRNALTVADPLIDHAAAVGPPRQTTAVTYGRYQLVSIAHLDTVRTMLQDWPRVVVGVLDLDAQSSAVPSPEHLRDHYQVAAANTAPERNPMTVAERVSLWNAALQTAGLTDGVTVEVFGRPGLDPDGFNRRFPPDRFDLVFPAASTQEMPLAAREEILGRRVHTVDPPLEFHTSDIRTAYRRGDQGWQRSLAPGTLAAFVAAYGPERLLALDQVDRPAPPGADSPTDPAGMAARLLARLRSAPSAQRGHDPGLGL